MCRNATMFIAAWSFRLRQRSSLNATSHDQCTVFSLSHWWRIILTHAASMGVVERLNAIVRTLAPGVAENGRMVSGRVWEPLGFLMASTAILERNSGGCPRGISAPGVLAWVTLAL